MRTAPNDEPREIVGSINAAGSALLTGAVMAAILGATELADPQRRWLGAILLAGCAVLSSVLIIVYRRAAAPLLPPSLLHRPHLRRGAIAGLLNTATTSSVATLLTLYLQDTLGRSPLAAAGTLLPLSLAAILGSILAASALRITTPERVCAAGLGCIAVAIAVLIAVSADVPAMSARMAASGLGIGLSSVAANSLGTDVMQAWRSAASGIINTTAQLGSALGIAPYCCSQR
ncbi:MAG: transporter [Pseudonocardiales bacterium]|nr:transporter [Pseudonocardiales bacterium]